MEKRLHILRRVAIEQKKCWYTETKLVLGRKTKFLFVSVANRNVRLTKTILIEYNFYIGGGGGGTLAKTLANSGTCAASAQFAMPAFQT